MSYIKQKKKKLDDMKVRKKRKEKNKYVKKKTKKKKKTHCQVFTLKKQAKVFDNV